MRNAYVHVYAGAYAHLSLDLPFIPSTKYYFIFTGYTNRQIQTIPRVRPRFRQIQTVPEKKNKTEYLTQRIRDPKGFPTQTLNLTTTCPRAPRRVTDFHFWVLARALYFETGLSCAVSPDDV